MSTFKKTIPASSRCSMTSSRSSMSMSKGVLTKACKIYLSKYQQVKWDIDSKTRLIKDMKIKRVKLDHKSRALQENKQNRQYKAEMVSSKEEIEQFLDVYKQHYFRELQILEDTHNLQATLGELQVQQKRIQAEIAQAQRGLKESKEMSKYSLECKKFQESVKEVRLRLVEHQLEINTQCVNRKLKKVRYYICQFCKQQGLQTVEDVILCEQGRVSALETYLKRQPIFVTLKRQVQQFIGMYCQLDSVLKSRPQLPERMGALKDTQEDLKSQLSTVQQQISSRRTKIEENTREIQKEGNKQIQLTLKALLDQNPSSVNKEAKQVVIEYQKRIHTARQKLSQRKYISEWLRANNVAQDGQNQLLAEKQTLDRHIHLETQALRNKLAVQSELEDCLDNIVSDRYSLADPNTKKSLVGSVCQPLKFDSHSVQQQTEPIKSKERVSRASSTCQSTGLLQSCVSRKSRLVSLDNTQRRLPITHGMSKKLVQEMIMSKITQKRRN